MLLFLIATILLICTFIAIIILIIVTSRYLNLKESYAYLSSELFDKNKEVELLRLRSNNLSSEIEVLSNENNELLVLVEKSNLKLSQFQIDMSVLTEQIKATHQIYNLKDNESDYTKAISGSLLILNALMNNDLESIDEIIKIDNLSELEKELNNISNLLLENFDYSSELRASVKQSEYSNNYVVRISSGKNTISFLYYTEYGSTFYIPTIIFHNSVDKKVKRFYEAIRNEDVYKLRRAISERDHIPTEEEAIEILNMYKNRFDIDTLEIDLVSFDNMKYYYVLKGSKNNIEASEIICGEYNEVPVLFDYFGYQEWKRVDPEY